MSLTKYSPGSVKELWSLSYPLMLSTLSILLMLFVDRLFLTFYSQDAFNASINASTTSWSFLVFLLSIGSISGVFVSQYNGNGLKEKFGEPVWQMLWFGLLSAFFFIPFAFFGPDLLWNADRGLEKQYFSWVILFGPSYAMYGALAGFFIGQGKTRFVSYLALGTNLINVFFDWVLIFGIEGWISPLGISGAAIATSFSQIFQVVILACLFLKKTNRLEMGTTDWKLKWKPFLQCLKIGFPGGAAACLETLGWAAFYEIMTRKGPDYLTATGIFQTLILILLFFGDGLLRGTSIIVGYLIGSKKQELIPKTLRSGLKLLAYSALFQIIAYLLVGRKAIDLFLSSYPAEGVAMMSETIYISMIFLIMYLFIDGIRFILVGTLTAAGDTLFLLLAGILSTWFFLVVPTYIAIHHFEATILDSLGLTNVYAILAMLVIYSRYKFGRWLKLDLSNTSLAL